jgi:hypothetical protein
MKQALVTVGILVGMVFLGEAGLFEVSADGPAMGFIMDKSGVNSTASCVGDTVDCLKKFAK